jgi:hypothetical protein
MGEEVTHEGEEAFAGTDREEAAEADRLLAEGTDVDAGCRQLEVSVQTYQR